MEKVREAATEITKKNRIRKSHHQRGRSHKTTSQNILFGIVFSTISQYVGPEAQEAKETQEEAST